MVSFPGNTVQFLIFIFIMLINFVSSRPQSYDENLNWRSQPYPMSNNGYQRYNQPPLGYPYNTNYNMYHRPRMQTESVSLIRPKNRGPQKEALPVPNSKVYEQNEFNSSVFPSNQGSNERHDRRLDPPNKKESTRILNSPPTRGAKPVSSSGEIMISDQSDSFVFPGNPILESSTSTTPTPNLDPESNPFIPDVSKIMSMCPPDATFCLYPGHYPSEHIKTALKKSTEKFDDLFGRDEIINNVTISTRIDVTIDGTPMCGSKEQVIEPSVARNKNNDWRFIVNEGPYVQGIRVEMCENPGGSCAMSENFPLSYTTECKQKYIYRKLLALESNGQVEPDQFRLPSCCTCIYRQDLALRFMKPSFGTSPRRK